jgi:MFS family permease
VVPYVVLSVPAGIIADRFDRRLVLLVSDLWRGAIMVALTVLVGIGAPVLLIAALAILATCGSAFFYPAIGAYLPGLVTDERQLGPANSAYSAWTISRSSLARPSAGSCSWSVASPSPSS